ncbi:MAG: hypothetical protein GY847_34850, partial [Proteobacteria bacterium]|nr:hypothetical protein [Pseudomonadota bacterium]
KEVLQNRKTPDFEELTDIEDIAKEREELAKVAKILYARKKKLDGMIKARLSDQDEVSAAGMNYRMINTQKVSYPLGKALDILVERTDLDREKTAEEISFIDKKAMDKVIKRLSKSMDRSQLNLLKAEISAITEVGYSPRMIAKATSI